jgi:primosomal protein N'
MAKPTHCQACSSVDLTTKGFGTEQIEQELVTIFPNAKNWEDGSGYNEVNLVSKNYRQF